MRALIIRFTLRALALLPLPINHALGYLLGMAFYLLPNKVKRISHINITLCLPEYSAQQRKTLLRKSLLEMGKSVTEMGPMWYWNAARLLSRITEVKNEALLLQALAHQQGVILLTPHLGSWELTSLQYARTWPITCLYRPPRIQALEIPINQARERTGAHLVPTNTSGVKALYAALARKEAIGLLPDQDPGKGGSVFVPFFGVAASTVKLVSRLINKTGAQVVMIYARRLPRGKGYIIHYLKPDDAIYASDPNISASAMNRAVEACVRENITQYQWAYKRFKTRPDGESSPYHS
jgi:KDO2-lipid IV(A) lauroyltransferase